jgi:hypothetical protein
MSVNEIARQEEEFTSDLVQPVQRPQRVLLVNGPPRSGKDTIGKIVAEHFSGTVYLTKFAKTLKERTHALYGLFESGTGLPLSHDFFEDSKDRPHEWFMGLTPRQAYIGVSERLMKRLHGEDVFGRLLLQDIELHGKDADLIVITDSGFMPEAEVVINHFGENNVDLIRVSMVGTSFEGDSRGYIHPETHQLFTVGNNETIWDLTQQLAKLGLFQLRYKIEAQLPINDTELTWFPMDGTRTSLESALATIESLRQREYGSRAFRVMVGSKSVRLVMPGDPPAVDLRG